MPASDAVVAEVLVPVAAGVLVVVAAAGGAVVIHGTMEGEGVFFSFTWREMELRWSLTYNIQHNLKKKSNINICKK